MSYLDRRHYQLLIAIRRFGQLSLAAGSLGLTQPAASHQIREAERRLGIRLFNRAGRSIRLTTAAERLLEAGLYAEDTLKTAETDAVRLDRGTSPTLRIAVGNYDHLHWLPLVAKTLKSEHDSLKLEVVRLANSDLQPAVMTGSADLFVVPNSSEFDGLPSVSLFEDRLVGVFSRSDSALTDKPVPAAMFNGRPYLAFQYHPVHGFEYERFFQPAGITPEVMRVESVIGILELIAAGFGASILPQWCISDSAMQRVITCDLAPDPLDVIWNVYGTPRFLSDNEKVLGSVSASLRASRAAAQISL